MTQMTGAPLSAIKKNMKYSTTIDDGSCVSATLNFAYTCNDDDANTTMESNSSSIYRFPNDCSTSTSTNNSSLCLAQSQCCTAHVYDVPALCCSNANDCTNSLNDQRSVQISAFPCSALTGTELCCHDPRNGKSSFFQIDINHEISRIHLVPLSARQKSPPLSSATATSLSAERGSNSNRTVTNCNVEKNQAAAVMLIIAHSNGLSIYSLVFTRTGKSDLFSVSESRELSESTKSCTLQGRRVTDLQVKLVIVPDNNASALRMQPHLLVATSSTPMEPDAPSHKVDVFAYPLVDHICPVFRFPGSSVAPIPAGYRYHSELVADVPDFKSLCFGPTRPDGACSLAVLSNGKLQVLQLPSLNADDSQDDEEVSNESVVSLTDCNGIDSIGEPVIVIPYIDTDNFAILCRPKVEELEFSPPAQISKRGVSFSLDELPTVHEMSASPFANFDSEGTPWFGDLKSRTFFRSPKAVSPSHPFDETLGVQESLIISPDQEKSKTAFNTNPSNPSNTSNTSNTSNKSFTNKTNNTTMSPLVGMNLLQETVNLQSPPFITGGNTSSLNNTNVCTPETNQNFDDHLAHILVVQAVKQKGKLTKDPKTLNDIDHPNSNCTNASHKIFASPLPSRLAYFSSASMIWIQVDALENTKDSSPQSPDQPRQITPPCKNNKLSSQQQKKKKRSLLCVVTNTAGSSQLHFTAVSVGDDEGSLRYEFDKYYETKQSLMKSLNNMTRKYEIRSISLEPSTCCHNEYHLPLPDVRILLYAKPDNDGNNTTMTSHEEEDSVTPSVLTEDGRVVVVFVSLGSGATNTAGEVEVLATASGRDLSTNSFNNTSSDAAMAKLEEIANSFRRFEAKMTRRMESIEKIISTNTSRIEKLEQAMDNLIALEI